MEQHIKELIYLKLTTGITEPEQALLNQWVAQSPKNKERYHRLMQDIHFVERYEQYAKIDEELAYQKFQKRHALLNVRRRTPLWRYAAMLLLPLLLVAGIWMYHLVTPAPVSDETIALIRQSGQHGRSKATLIVEDGKRIELQEEQLTPNTAVGYEVKACHVDEVTDSMVSHAVEENLVYALNTHADSEYWITLEDGTTVHLNYNTRLTYPVRFDARHRTVRLEGEAYFCVKEENARPFRVITPHGVVTEYGTSFNVNTFAPNCTKVVLVEGSISVKPEGGLEQKMLPGQLANLHALSAKAEIIDVDVEPYIAWNKGRFVFEDCPLEELMKVISNWYGVRVEFQGDSCKRMRFTGDMNRYGSLSPVLRTIREATLLEIRMNGNTIIIKECN